MIPPLPDQPGFYIAVAVGVAALLLIGSIGILRRLFRIALLIVMVGAIVLLIQERGSYDPLIGRIAGVMDLDRQRVEGGELRIPMSRDGHFWAHVTINGVERRLLVDSGATVTALASDTAEAAGIKTSVGLTPIILRTANGPVRPETGEIAELRMGNIVARELAVVVSPAFGETNVLGMNFLSRLKSWRVEGGTLVLVPHHPLGAAS